MLLDIIIAYGKGFFQPNVVCLAFFDFKIEIEAFHSKLENFFDVSSFVFVALNVLFSASLWQRHMLFFFVCFFLPAASCLINMGKVRGAKEDVKAAKIRTINASLHLEANKRTSSARLQQVNVYQRVKWIRLES